MQTPRRTFGLGARLALVFALLAALTALVTAGVSAVFNKPAGQRRH